jgi:hypothetical protein
MGRLDTRFKGKDEYKFLRDFWEGEEEVCSVPATTTSDG